MQTLRKRRENIISLSRDSLIIERKLRYDLWKDRLPRLPRVFRSEREGSSEREREREERTECRVGWFATLHGVTLHCTADGDGPNVKRIDIKGIAYIRWGDLTATSARSASARSDRSERTYARSRVVIGSCTEQKDKQYQSHRRELSVKIHFRGDRARISRASSRIAKLHSERFPVLLDLSRAGKGSRPWQLDFLEWAKIYVERARKFSWKFLRAKLQRSRGKVTAESPQVGIV